MQLILNITKKVNARLKSINTINIYTYNSVLKLYADLKCETLNYKCLCLLWRVLKFLYLYKYIL